MNQGSTIDANAARKRHVLLAYGAIVFCLYVWVGGAALPNVGVAKGWGYDLTPRNGGWALARVDPAGPAAASLRPGDRVVAIDGDPRVASGCVWALMDRIPPGATYSLRIEREGAERDVSLVVSRRTDDPRSADAPLYYLVGVAFLLVGLLVAAFGAGTAPARVMCATWITLAFGLLSQTLALLRDSLSGPELAVGIAAFPALISALALGFAFAYRFPWGTPRSRFWTALERVLYVWAGVTIAALLWHSLARVSGEPVRGPFAVPYPTFFLAANVAYQTYVAAAGLAMCAVSVRNLGKARKPAERRRVKWLIYGTVAGVAPFTALQTIMALTPWLARLPIVASFGWLATAALVLLPVFVAYGIATERLFDVEVVVRRGIKYLLAKGVLRTVVALLWAVLLVAVATHLDVTIGQLFAEDLWLVAWLSVTALSLRYRKPLGEWIDRKFFREAWDRERILRDLGDELERVDSLGEGATLLLSRLDATLHPKAARLFLERASGDGYESWSEGDEVSLPPERPATAEWTERAGGRLVVPMTGAGRAPVGVLVLADKRSEQPYSSTDKRLLTDVAARMAVVCERLRLEEREQHARYESEAKSRFLAGMSHELRTPLNAVLGFAQLIRRDRGLGAENREHVEVILRSGEHLLGLINDVLSIAKIEAGKLTLSESAFNLRRLLQSVDEMVRARARAKGVAFTVECADVPETVRGDEGKLRQVLVNLLGNAVKFTDHGAVALRVRWAAGRARFEVADTGRGIAPEEIGNLFIAFSQTESGRQAREGTGLGLVISREMVRLMGGDVDVASEPGRGTTFGFEVDLPAAAAEQPSPERRMAIGVAPTASDRRILVVDDTTENRVLLVKLLRSVGLDVREAANGAEAVEVWSDWRPHLIWMDQRMAVMDGREATREIRSREAASGERPTVSGERLPARPTPVHRSPFTVDRTKIVALTASAFEHEREDILACGCDDFVTKPYREETIFEKLEEHLGIEFVYGQAVDTATVTRLSVERLAAMPGDQLERLKQALSLGDVEEIRDLIEEIRWRDSELADGLAGAVRFYQYDAILDLAKQVVS